MITFPAAVPGIALATSAPRDSAMVKTVADFATAAQGHIFSRPCHHEVSSMWADADRRTCSRISPTGASRLVAPWRSSRQIMPVEIDRPSKSEASCRMGRLPSR